MTHLYKLIIQFNEWFYVRKFHMITQLPMEKCIDA